MMSLDLGSAVLNTAGIGDRDELVLASPEECRPAAWPTRDREAGEAGEVGLAGARPQIEAPILVDHLRRRPRRVVEGRAQAGDEEPARRHEAHEAADDGGLRQ